jgi:hypothetical protein
MAWGKGTGVAASNSVGPISMEPTFHSTSITLQIVNAYISWTGSDNAESLHEQFGVRFGSVESEIVG